jgi:mannose-6-phosphate isomerase-like protein (cupin superfamily)
LRRAVGAWHGGKASGAGDDGVSAGRLASLAALAVQIVRWKDRQRFSSEKMQKVGLVESPRFFCDAYGFEPGQSQKPHAHTDSDKVYMVLAGRARVRVGDDETDLDEGELVLAPAGSDHGVANPGPGRLVLLVFMAPKP